MPWVLSRGVTKVLGRENEGLRLGRVSEEGPGSRGRYIFLIIVPLHLTIRIRLSAGKETHERVSEWMNEDNVPLAPLVDLRWVISVRD